MRASSRLSAILIIAGVCPAQSFSPDIPKAWAEKDVAGFEVPLTHPDRSPRYMPEKEYYALRVRPIYRSYPVYAEGYEPAGYIEWLKQREPEVIFDAAKLTTKEDWIRAGHVVFDAENSFFFCHRSAWWNEGSATAPKMGWKGWRHTGFCAGHRLHHPQEGHLRVRIKFLCRMPHTSFTGGNSD